MDRLRFGTFLAPNIMPVYEAVTEEVGRRLGIETELVHRDRLRGLREGRERGLLRLQPALRRVRAPGHLAGRPDRRAGARGRPLRRQAHLLLGRHRPPRQPVPVVPRPARPLLGLQRAALALGLRHHALPPGRARGDAAASSARSSRPASTRRRCGWWPPARSTPPPSTPRCWPWRCATIRRWPARCASSTPSVPRPSSRSPCRSGCRPSCAREIQEVLTTMHEDPAMRERLALGMVERFVPVDASSYDDIRTMRDACEAAGFMAIRSPTQGRHPAVLHSGRRQPLLHALAAEPVPM